MYWSKRGPNPEKIGIRAQQQYLRCYKWLHSGCVIYIFVSTEHLQLWNTRITHRHLQSNPELTSHIFLCIEVTEGLAQYKNRNEITAAVFKMPQSTLNDYVWGTWSTFFSRQKIYNYGILELLIGICKVILSWLVILFYVLK